MPCYSQASCVRSCGAYVELGRDSRVASGGRKARALELALRLWRLCWARTSYFPDVSVVLGAFRNDFFGFGVSAEICAWAGFPGGRASMHLLVGIWGIRNCEMVCLVAFQFRIVRCWLGMNVGCAVEAWGRLVTAGFHGTMSDCRCRGCNGDELLRLSAFRIVHAFVGVVKMMMYFFARVWDFAQLGECRNL
eukprot:3419589-Pyramimonas_sp.AAC.1